MLEEILNFIHNFFVVEIMEGKFEINDGSLNDVELQKDQYFRIVGSVFNDGVYQFGNEALKNETFKGEIWALAIPSAVLDIVKEIEDWNEQYFEKINSPYQSESFGGYSYSKASGNSNTGESSASWKTVFGNRLSTYRRLP